MNLRHFVAAAAVTIALACAPHAQAADPDPSASPRPSCTATSGQTTNTISLAGALLTPHRVEEGLAWDARFIVDVDVAFDFRGGVLALAVPLPAGEMLLAKPGVTPIMEANRIVGLCIAPEAIRDRTISVSFVQPIAESNDHAVEIGAPVAAGSAVQIIDAAANGDTRLEITAGNVLERHVGYVAPRGLSHGAREEARRLTETRARITASPIYLRGDDVRAAGELSGRLVDPRARAKGNALGAGFLFAGIVGALFLAARRLRHSASVERADALLASEIEHASKESH